MASKMTAPIIMLLGSVSAAVGLMAWALRRAVTPGYERRYDLIPVRVSSDEIELPATTRTTLPGTFGLLSREGDEPAVVGEIISTTPSVVRRRLLYRPTSLSENSQCCWSGITRFTPESKYEDVVVETSLGPAPAWIVNAGSDFWAIHIHGQGSDRRQTLRGVTTASSLALTSLVITYRNDGEGPRSHDGHSHLGETEWQDLEAALRFVAKQGGTQCIIFGWSLGAAIAVNAVQRSNLTSMIRGLVMVAPVLSWEAVFRANARHHGMPDFVGSWVASLLASRGVSRLIGLGAAIAVKTSDASRLAMPFDVPTLILHGVNDWSVPIKTSRNIAGGHNGQVELVEFECSGHTQEWNSNPVGWDSAVRRWYGRSFPTFTAQIKSARPTD